MMVSVASNNLSFYVAFGFGRQFENPTERVTPAAPITPLSARPDYIDVRAVRLQDDLPPGETLVPDSADRNSFIPASIATRTKAVAPGFYGPSARAFLRRNAVGQNVDYLA